MDVRRTTAMTSAIVLILTLAGCQSVDIIRSSESPPPEWLNHVPDPSEGFVYFVGVSTGAATESSALDRARLDVVLQATQYLGGFAERDYQQRALSMNLESATLDPTVAAKDFINYANKNFVSQIRTKESYWELRRTPGGDQYFAYVLVPFPVNQSMSKFADQQVADAQKRVREAQTEDAKKQAQDVLDFWQETESLFERQ